MKDELVSLSADLSEPVLNSLIENDLIKEIPLIGDGIKIAKIGMAIPNLLFAWKTKGFIAGHESISEEKKQQFFNVLHENPDKAREAEETLIQAIDRAENFQKAAIIGRLFSYYVIGEITFGDLRKLLFAVDRAYLDDLLSFPEFAIQYKFATGFDPRSLDGTGLVDVTHPHLTADSNLRTTNPKYGYSKIGYAYARLMFGFHPGTTLR